MAFKCLIGTDQYDIVAYARQRDRDASATPTVADAEYQALVRKTIEDYEKFKPLGDKIVGNIGAVPITSPLNTVANQNRYYVPTIDGVAPTEVYDVLYRVGQVTNAAFDIAALSLTPYSPWLMFIDSQLRPTMRVIRDELFNELDHYGIGEWRTGRDQTGLYVDIYPVPLTAGLPILIAYRGAYPSVVQPDGISLAFASISNTDAAILGDLLYAALLEDHLNDLMKTGQVRAGLIDRRPAFVSLQKQIESIREDCHLALGEATPSFFASQ